MLTFGCVLLILTRELSDIDKDGRLSVDEYAIAMHLMARVRGGASLPGNLPPELYPGPTKYQTVDRALAKAGKPPLEKKVMMESINEQMHCIVHVAGPQAISLI